MNEQQAAETLRRQILQDVHKYYSLVHNVSEQNSRDSGIPYAGRVFDATELEYLVDASLDFWLTAGRYAEKFEQELAQFLGVKHCALVNSGSSANLLAFMTLASPDLGDRQIKPGDEVITVACGFPTTVAPIVQYGAIPVFVDVTLPSYNIDCAQIEAALSTKTKAVMIAHTMGNPFDLRIVQEFCQNNGLWLIEDNCDALGTKYLMPQHEWQYTGTIGDIGTSSFYPPHHITMGEGGAVYTNDSKLYRIMTSLRDWGRDCSCPPGKDNQCGRRFDQQFGELPRGYDHKYVYSHLGYNLKVTEMQAAIGCAQLQKLPRFIKQRQRNWQLLREGLVDMEHSLILPAPIANSEPSWFGFLITVQPQAAFSRDELVQYLEQNGIQTRMLFAGNLIKHPCFDALRTAGIGYRCIGELPVTNQVMRDTFWVGVYPGLDEEKIEFIIKSIRAGLNYY